MNLMVIRRYAICTFIVLCVLAGCKSNSKKGMTDGTYIITRSDTTADLKAVAAKADGFIAINRLDDAIIYLSANIHRFKGVDKAILLNTRGEAYLLKDNAENAVTDYVAATEADPENPNYVINLATAYENVSNQANALFFAKKVLEMQNASDSDRAVAQQVITRCDHSAMPIR